MSLDNPVVLSLVVNETIAKRKQKRYSQFSILPYAATSQPLKVNEAEPNTVLIKNCPDKLDTPNFYHAPFIIYDWIIL